MTEREHLGPSREPTTYRRRAWIGVALIPVFFLLAMAAGEGLTSALGYRVGDVLPLWPALCVAAVATAVCLVPCAGAVLFANRARHQRVRGALAPLIIGAVVGLGWIVLTAASEIGNLN